MDLKEVALEFARKDCEGRDCSHDFYHIQRVVSLALTLAKMENVEDLELVQLGATLHDVNDRKYSGEGETETGSKIRDLCTQFNYPEEKIVKLINIINGVSFSKELKEKIEIFPELAVVQDADRLDAIGAFGIARTMAFGATHNTVGFYDPAIPHRANLTKGISLFSNILTIREQYTNIIEQYTSKDSGTVVNHFYEKLLKLSSMMKTESGKKMAEKRHNFMVQFLEQMENEYNCLT